MKKTPLQRVKDEFGSKAALAEKLQPMLTKPEDESDEDFGRRLRTASNKQLLRLWDAEQRLKSGLGSKAALVDAIVKALFDGRDNADYRAKISRYTTTRLLDLHRQFC